MVNLLTNYFISHSCESLASPVLSSLANLGFAPTIYLFQIKWMWSLEWLLQTNLVQIENYKFRSTQAIKHVFIKVQQTKK
jgi:hypothetical protein